MSTRALGLLCLFASSAWMSRASATEPTVSLRPMPGDAGRAYLTGTLPASGGFAVTMLRPTERAESPVLDVWPEVTASCDDAPPSSGKQVYSIPAVVVTNPDQFEADVPHLQTGQRFCFRYSWREKFALDPKAVETGVAEIIDALTAAQLVDKNFVDGLASTLIARVCPSGARCDDSGAKALGGKLFHAMEALAPLAALDECDAQKRVVASKAKQIADVDAQAAALPPLDGVPLAGGAQQTSRLDAGWVGTLNDPNQAPPLARLDALRIALQPLPGDVAARWRNWVADRIFAQRAYEEASQKLAARQAAVDEAVRTLKKDMQDDATSFIDANVRVIHEAHASAGGDVSTHSNYISPDLGVALAFPLVHGEDPWLFAYGALNIYFTPVEREILLDQLVGDTFRQRVSLTVGFTLGAPGHLDGADVQGPLGGVFPVVGVGFRFASFARASALAVLYRAAARSELSDQKKFSAAIGPSASLDIDLIALFDKVKGP